MIKEGREKRGAIEVPIKKTRDEYNSIPIESFYDGGFHSRGSGLADLINQPVLAEKQDVIKPAEK